MRLGTFLFALCILSAHGLHEPKTLVLHPQLPPHLAVRGGAALSPELAAKIFTGAMLTQGTTSILAPDVQLQLYGVKEPNTQSVGLVKSVGFYFAAVGLVGYSLLFLKKSPKFSLGVGYCTIALDMVNNLLNNYPKKIGGDLFYSVFFLTEFLALAWACLTDYKHAFRVIRVVVVFGFLCGLGAFVPDRFSESTGMNLVNATSKAAFSQYCAFILAYVSMATCIVNSVSPARCLAAASGVLLLHVSYEGLVVKTYEKVGIRGFPAYLALLMTLTVAMLR